MNIIAQARAQDFSLGKLEKLFGREPWGRGCPESILRLLTRGWVGGGGTPLYKTYTVCRPWFGLKTSTEFKTGF